MRVRVRATVRVGVKVRVRVSVRVRVDLRVRHRADDERALVGGAQLEARRRLVHAHLPRAGGKRGGKGGGKGRGKGRGKGSQSQGAMVGGKLW